MEAYCIKCRKMTEMGDARKLTMKDGKMWIRGYCPQCGAAVWKRVESEDAPYPVSAFHLT
jgi:hypothetical protein